MRAAGIGEGSTSQFSVFQAQQQRPITANQYQNKGSSQHRGGHMAFGGPGSANRLTSGRSGQ